MDTTKAQIGPEGESAGAVTHDSRTLADALTDDFAATLRHMRTRRRWNQTELASEMFYDRTYVSHVEAGTRRPSRTFAERADRALGAAGNLLALWERQRGGTAAAAVFQPREQLLDSYDDVQAALWSVVDEASRVLVCAGSRSRDERYLRLIEDRLRAEPDLAYYRILFGSPWHAVLRDHLLRVIQIRDPRSTVRGAGKSVFLSLFDDTTAEPERFLCVNERRAVLPQLSLTGLSRYDTAFVVNDPARAEQWAGRLKEAYHAGRRIETERDILALPVLEEDDDDHAVPA